MIPTKWTRNILESEAADWSRDSKIGLDAVNTDLCTAYATEFARILAAESVNVRKAGKTKPYRRKETVEDEQKNKYQAIRLRIKENNIISALQALGFPSCADKIETSSNRRSALFQDALCEKSTANVDYLGKESKSTSSQSQRECNDPLSRLSYRERREILKTRNKAKKRKMDAQDLEILEKEQEALFEKAKIRNL